MRILLRTRNDVYPTPRSASPAQLPGPAASGRVPCGVCLRKGRLGGRQCPMCDGRGWRKRRPGEPAYDEYTGAPVATDETRRPGAMASAVRDAELERLHGLELVREGGDPTEAYGWEKAKARRDAGASYAELSRALERLREAWPSGWEFITWVYGSGLDVELDDWSNRLERVVVTWLSRQMRGQIRIPRSEHHALCDRKRREVRLLLDTHEPDEIADLIAMPRRWVASVVAEDSKAKARVS